MACLDPLTDAPKIAAGLQADADLLGLKMPGLAARLIIAAQIMTELRARCMDEQIEAGH